MINPTFRPRPRGVGTTDFAQRPDHNRCGWLGSSRMRVPRAFDVTGKSLRSEAKLGARRGSTPATQLPVLVKSVIPIAHQNRPNRLGSSPSSKELT